MSNEIELKKAFISIMSKESKNNTYKFALARYILEHIQKIDEYTIKEKIKNNENLIITYDEIAGGFLRYYWHQECKYRIRQNFNPNKLPYVITEIRNVFGNDYVSGTLKKIRTTKSGKEKIMQAQNNIRRKVFEQSPEVVPRFQNIRQGRKSVHKELFYIDKHNEKLIEIKSSALNFLNNNQVFLTKVIILEWAKFLEKINTLPKLISKINLMEHKRTNLRNYVKIFKDFQHCFYCNDKINDSEKHIDHFIPWSYIFEDEAWNLVIACQKCNCRKNDSLAENEFLKELIRRNDTYQSKISKLERSLFALNTHKGWKIEIQNHYSSCIEYGFNPVSLP